MERNHSIPELPVPGRLANLIKYCERACVAECCGIDAFDFSPLHVASCISASTGSIGESAVAEWTGLIAEFERNFDSLGPTGEGLVCRIGSMNQLFTEAAIRALFTQLRTSVAAAPAILELSNRLEAPVKAWSVMKDYEPVTKPRLP